MMSERKPKAHYPKPGPVGGKLIREIIKNLKRAELVLPLSSYIQCALSSGPDSTALAHILAKYGRRVVDLSRIRLIHINHGWRGTESDGDESFARDFAERYGLHLEVVRAPASQAAQFGVSWENEARQFRKSVFKRELERHRNSWVFTAHHADDLAETVLWRILTGAALTHGGGISLKNHREIRPLLTVRKREIEEYLKEEGLSWRVDRTNFEGRFLRSQMRMVLMPELERLFPKGIEHLVKLALQAQTHNLTHEVRGSGIENILMATGLRLKRTHFDFLERNNTLGANSQNREIELHLPEGWKLRREKLDKRRLARWILEKM